MRGEGRGGAEGLEREASRGSGAPSWGDSRRTEGRGRRQPGDLLSTRGPGRTQMRDCVFGASRLSWPYKFFVTRWVL